MDWDGFLDVLAAICLLVGAFLALVAAIGVLRFPDLLTRMHAATKPQVLGLILIVIGLGLRLRSPTDIGMLALVAAFQLLTAPVSSHMVGRTAFRKTPIREDLLLVDELTPRLSEQRPRPGENAAGGEG
ncbi:monovalent cation/H(+) antiporter subunit G [Nocardioidaceae bacterium SCSIO 66511]|nr:monovalent cation/H(+) antiporter subunit G [Nocardioidaceae bacterium SCSIO 66511]